ncbi:hypothetical protein ACH4EB_38160, partial [Streptomyces sp. NPDC018045]
ATVAVTPPNETTSLTLKWPWGPLVDQMGATHPGGRRGYGHRRAPPQGRCRSGHHGRHHATTTLSPEL